MGAYSGLLGSLSKHACQSSRYQHLLKQEALLRFYAEQAQAQANALYYKKAAPSST